MVNPIQITQPQAYSGGADFSPLAKLYDIYKASQQRAMEEAAYGRLGDDPAENARILTKSGVAGPATQGLNLQLAALNRQREDTQQAIVNARMAEAQKLSQGRFGIEQSQEQRVQEEYAKKLRDEAEAAKLFGGLGGGQAPRAPSPFPAALPGSAPGPRASAVPQGPPVLAEGDDGGGEGGGGPAEGGLPAWADLGTAKIMSNLTSGAPVAAAGIPREQLAELYRNPITRPIATAYLQKQMDPGTYSWQQVGDKLIRTNNKSGEEKVVMTDTKPYTVGGSLAVPDGQGGFKFITPPDTKPIHQKEDEVIHIPDGMGGYKTIGVGNTKAQRELEGNTYKADVLQLTGKKREFMVANGRLPSSEDISPGDKRQIDKLQTAIDAVDSASITLTEMENLDQQAFKGWGASFRAVAAANVLPSNTEWAKRGQATLELNNEMTRSALNQLKATFTGSQSKEELAVLREVQGAINNPGTMNANVFKRARALLELRAQKATAQQEGIRTGEIYKPGGIKTDVPTEPAPATKASSSEDLAAAKWARDNPNDPKAKAIIQHLKSKSGGL